MPRTNNTKSNEVPVQDTEGKKPNNSISQLLSLNYCPHCDKNFSDESELKKHLKSGNLYEYECLNCDEAFHLKKQLDSHLSKYHKITNQQEDNSLSIETQHIKGQLISKCPYEKSVSSKLPTNFCPEIFCSFVGASCRLPYLLV